jgi:hypothetical protein
VRAPRTAVGRLAAVWSVSVAWKLAALALFLLVVARVTGGGGG